MIKKDRKVLFLVRMIKLNVGIIDAEAIIRGASEGRLRNSHHPKCMSPKTQKEENDNFFCTISVNFGNIVVKPK
jgi:hypothetical protein